MYGAEKFVTLWYGTPGVGRDAKNKINLEENLGALAAKEPCLSGEYTTSGECCKLCLPGEGETFSESYSHTETCQPCTLCTGMMRMQTPCTDSNDAICICDYGYFMNEQKGRCEECTLCPEGTGMIARCEHDHDTVCEDCPEGTYSDQESALDPCLPCSTCEEGLELEVQECKYNSDTVCKASPHLCSPYLVWLCSDPDVCFPGQAEKTLLLLQYFWPFLRLARHNLSSISRLPLDANPLGQQVEECNEQKSWLMVNGCANLNPRFASSSPPLLLSPSPTTYTDVLLHMSTPEDVTPTTKPGFTEFIGRGLNEKLIPIYCSILAAVVLGVLAFIIFKRWNSYKQNKQGANNRTVNQTPSPEGEKLHSDSGISVDSQSLQEQQQQTQAQAQAQTQAQTVVVKVDGGPTLALPPHKREEVEKLLNKSCGSEDPGDEEETDWCNLAGLLGYQEEHIASFRQEEHPIRALLSDWASKDCASVDALCTALRKINRDDIAQSLMLTPNTEPTATSAV
ncbi:hypothetical protein JZ751_026414 [Albula glossodonta]|uniref:Nerve growth factor receptor n=1 Tax=Albula glossodonta TaxID=121402 RepID=A0A8T2PFW6_9TELE|nr:hypothetical protein JZ751_026414 [Albula glossodonta]